MTFQLNILKFPDHIAVGAYDWNLLKSISGWHVIGLAMRDYIMYRDHEH